MSTETSLAMVPVSQEEGDDVEGQLKANQGFFPLTDECKHYSQRDIIPWDIRK